MSRRQTKSPLKDGPLRTPGQSLQSVLDDKINSAAALWAAIVVVFVWMAGMEWYRYLTNTALHPWISTAMAIGVIPIAVWRIRRMAPTLRQLQLGLDGERVVGQMLERLRADGYEVLHDVPGNGANIDHVLVGPGGVFAIETKTIRKPKGDQRVVFDGQGLTVAGLKPDRDPIAQVRAVTAELKRIIHDRAGLEVNVRSVVIYPGWFTETRGKSDVWVLNENAFPKWLANEDHSLAEAEIRQISTGIARHIWDSPS